MNTLLTRGLGFGGPLVTRGLLSGTAPPPPVRTSAPIRQAVAAQLLADAGLAALVGTRVYPRVIPQSAKLPALAFQVVSIPRTTTRDLRQRNLLTSARVQVSVSSKLDTDCEAVAEALRQVLDGFTGDLGGSGVIVVETYLADERDLSESTDDKTARPVFRTVIDFVIRYREPSPARIS